MGINIKLIYKIIKYILDTFLKSEWNWPLMAHMTGTLTKFPFMGTLSSDEYPWNGVPSVPWT